MVRYASEGDVVSLGSAQDWLWGSPRTGSRVGHQRHRQMLQATLLPPNLSDFRALLPQRANLDYNFS